MLQNGMLVSSVSEDMTLHQQQLHNCVNAVDVSMMPMFRGFCCDNSLDSGQVLDLRDHSLDNTLLGAHGHLPTPGDLSLAIKVAVPGNTSNSTTAAAASSCCQMSMEKEIPMTAEKVYDDDVVFIENNEPNSNKDSLSTKTEADDDEIAVVEEECEEKRTKVEARLEYKPKKRTRGGNSSPNPKENPKASPVHKPNYIHVRARRGQATDSHSLAERARREKISKKMKCLQDLVPGCSKIVGKAGVLDEIINYVQSLQVQVEFLSMKLATHNPRLDFNVKNFTAQEETPACAASFPAAPMSSALVNLAELQLNPGQQVTTNYELEGPIYAPQNAVEAATSSSVSILEPYTIDSSCFTQIQRLPTCGSDLLCLEDGVLDQE